MSIAAFFGVALVGAVIAARFPWIASSRAGWLMYLANVAWELIEKRAGVPRPWTEYVAAFLGLGLMWVGGLDAAWVATAAFAVLAAELAVRARERRVLGSVYATLDERGIGGSPAPVDAVPAPSVRPRLTISLVGLFVRRSPSFSFGWLSESDPLRLSVVVANHTQFPTQRPVTVVLEVPGAWHLDSTKERTVGIIGSGQVMTAAWLVEPTAAATAQSIHVYVRWDRGAETVSMHADGVIGHEDRSGIRHAVIERYPGARRAAFAWRGDMDLYDTSSCQTLDGVRDALALGGRYGIAQTMYLSTRLTLDQEAAAEWADHYGVDRGAAEIPAFTMWLRDEVELCHSRPYPVRSEWPFVMELGNHGHLHYDTDASGAPGNGWRAGAKPGQGRYPWSDPNDTTSYGDQRSNILEAQRWVATRLDYEPRSWAKPGRANDTATPKAVADAGIEVASGSDISRADNVIRQPAPHLPTGTGIVELTARYPSDPRHVFHAMMLEFWMHRAHRRGIPMIMLVHQHMRAFDGPYCARFTEHLLRAALERFNGDLYVDTVYGIGVWWRDVLNEATRRVHVHVDGSTIIVENDTDRQLEDVPVDITLEDGRRMARLVSVAARTRTVIRVASEGLNVVGAPGTTEEEPCRS